MKKKMLKTGIKHRELRWDKLDNTANLFPVIVSETVSNVFRISVTLKEDIDEELLQKALNKVLPYFDVFKSRMKKGIFWYYFETNRKPAPKVMPENTYPCLYINPYTNNEYQFRVTYFEKRINLEVFHVLTDGNGAFTFLKEITYQYLRFKYPELMENSNDILQSETSLDREDSYLKNYKKSAKKTYKTEKAVIIKGEKLPVNHFGIIHGYIDLPQIKAVAKKYGVTINQYLLGVFVWSVYREYLGGMPSENPISACVPVNLRPYFNSDTTKNFFAVVSAVFKPTKDNYTFEEVLEEVAKSLSNQINKENLEKIFSYNVSNEKNWVVRAIPLFVKNIAMKFVYKTSARANTTTITNLGIVNVVDEYRDYIDKFHTVLSMSKGQNIKGSVCTFNDVLVFTFSSAIRENFVQKAFFRKLVEDGINVSIESNGVYYE
ncbi:MAG: hypothetical protein J6A25_05180 [Lachnospiraceae bacterium]|nr:hypothetical protein [Lachnospiraceae bacterium]